MWKTLSIFCLLLMSATPQSGIPSRRLAIDIGGSSVKVKVADVSRQRGACVRTVYQNTYRIPIREEIESSGTRELSKKITTRVRDVVAQTVQFARSLGATEVAAVATLVLKNAKNSEPFIADLEKASGVRVTFIDQDQESAIGFEGAASVDGRSRYDLIVWDIGGEATEMTTLSRHGNYIRYETRIGSVTFADLVLSEIKRENPAVVTTPNPLSKEQIDKAVELAAEKAKEIPQAIREKIGMRNTAVVGIGALPFLSLDSLGPTHSLQEIKESLYEKADKKDSQLLGPYPNHVVTNLALVAGTMEELGIKELTLEVVELPTGLVLLPQYLQPMPGVEQPNNHGQRQSRRESAMPRDRIAG